MSLFEKKAEVSRSEFRESLRKASSSIPGGGRYSKEERVKIEKDLLPENKYGGRVSQKEVKKCVKILGHKRYLAGTENEERNIARQMRFLKKIGGI